jgi:hypothetical protein
MTAKVAACPAELPKWQTKKNSCAGVDRPDTNGRMIVSQARAANRSQPKKSSDWPLDK